MDVSEKVRQLLEEKYASDEVFSDCYTVDIELKGGKNLFVYIDSDSGIDFDKCRALSRYLEQHLDTQGWLGDSYVLEVSSPGIDRPLKFLRQYQKNIGRKLRVDLLDKRTLEGVLHAAEATQIVLLQTVVEKEGNKKKTVEVLVPVELTQIEKAVVQLAF